SNKAMYKIVRPTTGEAPRDMNIEELTRKYSKVSSLKEAKIDWEDDYEASSKQNGKSCSVGSRLKEVNVLGGAILPVWGNIQTVLSKQARQMDKMLRIVRVETTSDNRRFVGLHLPNEAVETVLE
ncbi:strawberry notch-like protein, partial [Trifolium medium]|nr:strawberry notch-like protein [Trifolium medium]